MVSISSENEQYQHNFIINASKALCESVWRSFGGMDETMNFLEPIEQL